jgi:hypothetical protein
MMNSFTVCGNGKDRARNVKNEQQRDIFALGKPVIPDEECPRQRKSPTAETKKRTYNLQKE